MRTKVGNCEGTGTTRPERALSSTADHHTAEEVELGWYKGHPVPVLRAKYLNHKRKTSRPERSFGKRLAASDPYVASLRRQIRKQHEIIFRLRTQLRKVRSQL